MTLTIPAYLKAANIQDRSVRYEWDDWNDLPALDKPDAALAARLKRVSQRAVLAFMCATAEWIVFRFGTLCDDPAPWAYIEAAWAAVIHVRYVGYGTGTGWQEFAVKGWDGPVRGPIKDALELLETGFQQLSWEGHTDPTRYAVLMAPLARYVMTDPGPYNDWSERVIGRLEALYPRDPADALGDVVPRQAVDPAFDFLPEQTEPLINQFLASLDFRRSAFLSSPEGMLEHFDGDEDFSGTPYRFEIQADRQSRRRARSLPLG